jgi:hypothetical protein
MPNGVKYSTTTPTGALRKDNVALGVTGNLGPTSTTGFYSMPTPISGKYIINKVAASGIPNFFAPANDAELIRFAVSEGATGANIASAAAVLAWIATQPNLEAANFQYEGIVTNGLVYNADAGFIGSYPTTGTTLYDLSGNNNNGTLVNGTTFNSANSGSFVFDGVDDYVATSFTNLGFNVPYTIGCWFNTSVAQSTNVGLFNLSYFPELIMTPGGKVFVWNSIGPSAGVVTGYPGVESTNSYNNGQWHYAVGSYTTGGLVKLYINGTLINSANYAPDGVRAIYDGIYMGAEFNNGPKIFNGKIAIGQVYNRQITDQEVLQNYNAQKGRFGL